MGGFGGGLCWSHLEGSLGQGKGAIVRVWAVAGSGRQPWDMGGQVWTSYK